VNFFQHENSGQPKGVFSGIVDDMQGVEYTLQKGTIVGAGPELLRGCLSHVSIKHLLT